MSGIPKKTQLKLNHLRPKRTLKNQEKKYILLHKTIIGMNKMAEQTPNKLDKHPDTLFPEARHGSHADKKPAAAPHHQPESIILTSKNGQEVELTSSKLEAWFTSVEVSKQNEEEQSDSDESLSSMLLSRYGLKNSIEVIHFLRSPAGESILTMISEQLAEIASIQEYQRAEMLDAQRRYDRMLAFLLLALIHKHDAKAKSLNEHIQQQIDKLLKKKPEAEKSVAAANKILEKQYASLEESAKSLENMLGIKTNEIDALHQERLALHHESLLIDERHFILHDSISGLDNDADLIMLNPEIAPNHLVNRMQALNAEFHENSREISKLEAENRGPEARRLLHRNHGLRLYIDGLDDMHAVHRKEKILYTADGEETDSYKKAKYILTPDLKFVKDGAGLRYLIGAQQNLADMDESMKAQAQIRFNTLKPEICCVKNQVHHHCKREKEHHAGCVHSVNKRIDCCEKELTLIKNQHHHIRAAQANVMAEMRKLNPDMVKAANMQNAMPNVASGTSVNKTPLNPAMTLRQSMDSLQRNPNQQNINNLTANVVNAYGQVPGQLRQDLNKIIPGKPIPEPLLRSLNRSIYKLKMATDIPEPAPEAHSNPTWPPKPHGFR